MATASIGWYWRGASPSALVIAAVLFGVGGMAADHVIGADPAMPSYLLYRFFVWSPLVILFLGLVGCFLTMIRVTVETGDPATITVRTLFSDHVLTGRFDRVQVDVAVVRQPGVYFGGVLRNLYVVTVYPNGAVDSEEVCRSVSRDSANRLARRLAGALSLRLIDQSEPETRVLPRTVFIGSGLLALAIYAWLVREKTRTLEYVNKADGEVVQVERGVFANVFDPIDWSAPEWDNRVVLTKDGASVGRPVVLGWLQLELIAWPEQVAVLAEVLEGVRWAHDDDLPLVRNALAERIVTLLPDGSPRQRHWQTLLESNHGISVSEYKALIIEVVVAAMGVEAGARSWTDKASMPPAAVFMDANPCAV